jgi:flavin reductase (DIM6/NTAB) family NADH-FMN oxidoreductase RutF
MLGARNRDAARKLSGPAVERFDGDHWREGPFGLPIIDNATAWMIGRIVERLPVAGAAVVVVQIEQGALGEDDAPLLYHERSYHAPRPLD